MRKISKKNMDAIKQAQDAIAQAAELLGDVIADAETYRDERSEGWQEGEAGEAYGAWIEQLEEAHEALTAAAECEIPHRP